MDTITFECECGKVLKVEKRLAGRKARCPACGVTVRIPSPNGAVPSSKPAGAPASTPPAQTAPPEQPASASPPPAAAGPPAASAEPAPASTMPSAAPATGRTGTGRPVGQRPRFPVYELVCGCLILATLVLPWAAMRGRVAMSWDVLKGAPTSVQVVLIFMWIIGATTIVVSSLLRGKDAALWHGILGLAGMLLLMFLVPSGPALPAGLVPDLSGLVLLGLFGLLFLLGMIITTNIRLRLGMLLAVRIVQGVFAGGALILSVVGFIWYLHFYSQLPEWPGSAGPTTVGDLVFIILVDLGEIAGIILAVIHAAAGKITKDTLSRTALGLVYGAIGCTIVYWIVRPAMLAEAPGLILTVLNVFLLIVPVLFLFCSGVIGFVCGLVTELAVPPSSQPVAPRVAASEPAGAVGVQQRLQELASLRDQGLITEEDYAVKRAAILNEL